MFFVRRKSVTTQIAFETSTWVALVWGGFVAVASALFTIYVLPWLNPDWQLDWFGVLPICAVVPLLLLASYANSTQLATDRIKDYGDRLGGRHWELSPLLERLAADGGSLAGHQNG